MSSPAESLQNISARINSRFNELFRKAKVSKTFTEDVLSDFNKLRGVFRYWALEKGLSASLEDRMKRHYALRGMENRAYELLQAVRDKFMVILISLNKGE